jgi:hypothetical protein
MGDASKDFTAALARAREVAARLNAQAAAASGGECGAGYVLTAVHGA